MAVIEDWMLKVPVVDGLSSMATSIWMISCGGVLEYDELCN